ncbi:hypothetical protein SRABI118_03859 [Massilia sp. Bi118]|nr:hypothetical protein SRABI118_03859 [Massilia sp. Bi118]
MFMKYVPLAAALLAAGAAQAQVGITADLGTTGAGFHVVVPMESNLNGRFGANYFKHDFDRSTGQLDYTLKGKLQTFDILFDWYVRDGSPFHLTGGLVYNGNRFDATANPLQNGQIIVNGHSYTAADIGIVKGNIDYRKAAPYLGIGWGNALAATNKNHWSFNADLGAFFQGNPNVKLGSYGCTVAKIVCDLLNEDIAAERLRLKDDIDSFKVYPVLRASLNYSF